MILSVAENYIRILGRVVGNMFNEVPEDGLMAKDLHIIGYEDIVNRTAARIVDPRYTETSASADLILKSSRSLRYIERVDEVSTLEEVYAVLMCENCVIVCGRERILNVGMVCITLLIITAFSIEWDSRSAFVPSDSWNFQ